MAKNKKSANKSDTLQPSWAAHELCALALTLVLALWVVVKYGKQAQPTALNTARAEERFHEMDINGDEMVTLAEFQEANFDTMDRDGDGVLTGSELRRQRGPGGSRESGSRRGSDRRGRPRGNSGGQY